MLFWGGFRRSAKFNNTRRVGRRRQESARYQDVLRQALFVRISFIFQAFSPQSARRQYARVLGRSRQFGRSDVPA